MTPQYEKMSKSRGNVILPEEVIYGVANLDERYEFRDIIGNVLDYKEQGVWQDKDHTGFFFTASNRGKKAAYLCEKGNPVPCILLINGEEKQQHPGRVEYYAYRKE